MWGIWITLARLQIVIIGIVILVLTATVIVRIIRKLTKKRDKTNVRSR